MTDFNKCNYSCPYCIARNTGKEFNRDAFWKICCKLIDFPYNLNVRIGVAGEFFLSPDLINGAKARTLSKNVKSVNLITNLSFPKAGLEKTLEGFDLDKLAMVASFHPYAMKMDKWDGRFRNTLADEWLGTAKYVQRLIGSNLTIALVAYPPLLKYIKPIRSCFTEEGLTSFVQGFIGEYKGNIYPLSYTEREKELARQFCYSRHDYEFFFNMRLPGLCNAGHSSIFIDMTGTISRCGLGVSDPPLGNILKSLNFELYREPRICNAITCLCDTENMNTVIFDRHYKHTCLNQHVYRYRFEEIAKFQPWMGEWRIHY
jgi:MoaA/NifB/PqqE/SkfB family radical SAM enzyme